MGTLSTLRVVAAVLAAAGLATAGTPSRLERRQKALAEGERLLAEERWDDALAAMAPWGQGVADALLRRIADLKARRGDPQKLLALYEAYFRFYPFGVLYWHSDARRWNELAFEYAQSLKAATKGKDDEAAAQTLTAEPVYRTLTDAQQKNQEPQASLLAHRLVGECPKSLFAPAAVLTLANMKAQARGDGAQGVAVCEEFLPLLRKGGSGERAQVLVLLTLADACTNFGNDPERLRKGVAAYLEVASLTSVAYEKRFGLLHAAQAALKSGKGDALVQCRKLFAEFLAKYPAAFEADDARRGLVQADLAEGKPEQALQTLRALEKQAPEGSDLAEPLFDISRAWFAQQDYNKSLAILQEIAKRYPDTPTASMAWLGMGEVYGKLGLEDKMVEAYRTAAPPASRASRPAPASWTPATRPTAPTSGSASTTRRSGTGRRPSHGGRLGSPEAGAAPACGAWRRARPAASHNASSSWARPMRRSRPSSLLSSKASLAATPNWP
ncbi:MAG: hypothetical protein FJ290_09510 [Planctomycetes bacterium]|nr:hypothetical protein [Planctomycetota bacterium]